MSRDVPYDAVVIGGGFYGCTVALYLRTFLGRVLVVEQEPRLLARASYANQARVHQGYHYPRSLLTALRSRVNFDRFVRDHPECVDASFTKLYAVGRQFSNVTAAQFRAFCERIEAPLAPAPRELRALFDLDRVEEVFLAREIVFDAVKLADRMARALPAAGVEVALQTEATRVAAAPGDAVDVTLAAGGEPRVVRAGAVFNCTYSAINHLLGASGLPLVALKHEATEMALVVPPPELRGVGITVMCGPFFSLMPFPPLGLHTLSHVRYTPHHEWSEREGDPPPPAHRCPPLPSHFDRMVRDAMRYVPSIERCRQEGSIWEVKTVLPSSEHDDSRPILFRPHHGLRNLFCVMGGKIDNVYDVLEELRALHAAGGIG